MKRLLLLLALVGFMAGCGKSDNGGVGSDEIVFDESDIKITLEGGYKQVRFTAGDSWSAEVIFDGGSEERWLTVSPTSGEAGLVKMRVTLAPNTGKEARSASIVITSGKVRQSIDITQAGTDTPTNGEYEDVSGTDPDDPDDPADDDDDSDDNSYTGDLTGDMPDNEIWYLSTNGYKAVCNYDGFGVQILSETYKNGKGVIKFSGTVKVIETYAFEENLRSIRIPESVTKIGNHAFLNCFNLKEITIPNSVTSIGDGAFQNCWALTKVKMSENITSIGSSAFSNCEDLKELNIPRGVKYIDICAFINCTSLTDIIIPEGMESLGAGVFSDCVNLVSATIPGSVTTMEASIFSDCSSLKNVTLTDGLTVIGQSMFWGCTSLTNITIPRSVKSIGNSAFKDCTNLSSVVISEGVESIGSSAFYDCTGLTSITIPASITSLEYEAFKECTGLKEIYCKSTTPPSLGSYIFENTAETLKIYVPRASVDTYKTNSNWKKYVDRIFGYDF
ncbi:MAG: leucine-rich repeat protein [Rikenellaceae bacterium]|nr:leucine-rich repeat protein [Rikenellaceae bacterium]